MTSINDDLIDNQQRVAIFIDGSNFYHSMDENCKRYDVDFSAFTAKVSNGRKIYRTYYYNVQRIPDRNPQAFQEQQKFLNALYNLPYFEIRMGTPKMRGEVAVEKGVDIMVATDMLQLAWTDLYDTAILVSGDGDFAYAVQAVKNLGKHVQVAAFPSNLALELANVADERILLAPKYFENLWSKKRTPQRKNVGSVSRKATSLKMRLGIGRPKKKDAELSQANNKT